MTTDDERSERISNPEIWCIQDQSGRRDLVLRTKHDTYIFFGSERHHTRAALEAAGWRFVAFKHRWVVSAAIAEQEPQ